MSSAEYAVYLRLADGVDRLGLRLMLDASKTQAQLDIHAAGVRLVSSGRRTSVELATGMLLQAMRNCPHPGLREIARSIRV